MQPIVAALAVAAGVSLAQLPIADAQTVPLPNKPDGFLRLGSATAQVVLDVHVDLLCPDCASDWPIMNALSAHYSSEQLAIIFHLFPLPYHTYAFSVAQGANVIASLNASSAAQWAWANALFSGAQQNFWNDVVSNDSSTQVVQQAAALAAQTVDGVSAAAFINGMQDPNLNEATRISWKYGCSRGVTGTPSHFVNGLSVDADSFTLAQWTALLDPLFANASALVGARRATVQLSGFKMPFRAYM